MRRHKPEVYGIELPRPIDEVLQVAVNVARFRHRRGLGPAQTVRDAEAALREFDQNHEALIPGSVLAVAFPDLDPTPSYQAWAHEPLLLHVID